MTPNQGNNPDAPGGRRPPGTGRQGSPDQQPPQPPAGQSAGQGPPGQQQPGQQAQQPPGAYQAQMAQQQQAGQGQPVQQFQGAPQPGQPAQTRGQLQSAQRGPSTQATMQAQRGAMGATQGGAQAQPGGGQVQARGGRRGAGVRMRPIRVEEIVETDVVTARRDTPIATVVATMAEEDVGSVVVVEDDTPVGIITDRNVALALENTPDVAQKQAGELISGDLVTATTSMSVFDSLRRLSDEGIRRLPIVDDEGALQGIITLDDILVLLGSELNKAGETIRAQSPRL